MKLFKIVVPKPLIVFQINCIILLQLGFIHVKRNVLMMIVFVMLTLWKQEFLKLRGKN